MSLQENTDDLGVPGEQEAARSIHQVWVFREASLD
jgi:hypothetical protein